MSARRRRLRRPFYGVALIACACAELGARAVHDPTDADFFFDWTTLERRIARAAEGSGPPGPQGQPPITADGFRGSFPWPPPAGERPIVVTGAGETFAAPVRWGEAWPERLAAALAASGDPTPVMNLAVPGSTVLFARRVLEDDLVASAPRLAILGHGGFNEALLADLPEAVYLARPAWDLLLSSAALRAGLRGGLRAWAQICGRTRTAKVPPAQLRAELDALCARLQDAGVPVILLQQHVVAADIPGVWRLADLEGHRAAVAQVAAERGLPLVDPRPLLPPPDARWFHGGELYTAEAHTRIADALLPVVDAALRATP